MRAPIPNLKISVTPSLVGPVTTWAKQFNALGLYIWNEVQFEGNVLTINIDDLCNFLRIANPIESSPLDTKRLRVLFIKALEKANLKFKAAAAREAVSVNQRLLITTEIGKWYPIENALSKSSH